MTLNIGFDPTGSLFYGPLLLDASGMPGPYISSLQLPQRWGQYVDRYRLIFEQQGITPEKNITSDGQYTSIHPTTGALHERATYWYLECLLICEQTRRPGLRN